MTRLFACLAIVATAGVGPAAPPNLDGTWLFDAATIMSRNEIQRCWTSVVTVKDSTFAMTDVMGHPKPLTGKLVFDAADAKAVDLVLDELDFAATGMPMKIPAATHRGIIQAEKDRVTICFARLSDGKRPTSLVPTATGSTLAMTLARAPAGFAKYPGEITVRVSDAEGHPLSGVVVATYMSAKTNIFTGSITGKTILHDEKKTGPDGTVKVKFDEPPKVVRDVRSKGIAFPVSTPARLAGGELKVTLSAECKVTGQIVCEALAKSGGKMQSNVYLMRDGQRVAECGSVDGRVEFLAPPGTYTLEAYGSELHDKVFTVNVPEDQSEFALGSIALKPTSRVILKGKPAPELIDIRAWAGTPVKLADLKGQIVLLNFWSYGCNPCVESMPVLIELHEKYHDKGLAIIGMHVDNEGEIDTPAKLSAKITGFEKDIWKGKKLPFPNALLRGDARGGPEDKYGITGHPTTILIDRGGNVVGEFAALDFDTASLLMKSLLAVKK